MQNDTPNEPASTPAPEQQALLPSPELGLRVNQAEFARLMGVSRAAACRWVKDGRIQVGADGRFCPRAAARSLLATTDPSKLRSRILKGAAAEASGLRDRVDELETALEERDAHIVQLRGAISRLERDQAEAERQLEILPGLLIAAAEALAAMPPPARRKALAEHFETALVMASDQLEAEHLGLDDPAHPLTDPSEALS